MCLDGYGHRWPPDGDLSNCHGSVSHPTPEALIDVNVCMGNYSLMGVLLAHCTHKSVRLMHRTHQVIRCLAFVRSCPGILRSFRLLSPIQAQKFAELCVMKTGKGNVSLPLGTLGLNAVNSQVASMGTSWY